jgi:hypothetical protein
LFNVIRIKKREELVLPHWVVKRSLHRLKICGLRITVGVYCGIDHGFGSVYKKSGIYCAIRALLSGTSTGYGEDGDHCEKPILTENFPFHLLCFLIYVYFLF